MTFCYGASCYFLLPTTFKVCITREVKKVKQIQEIAFSLWLVRTEADKDCINILIGQFNNTATKKLDMSQFGDRILLLIDDINVDDLQLAITIESVWNEIVSSVTSVTTQFYYGLFEAFIAKSSCAVVWPTNVDALKWTKPFLYDTIPRMKVNSINLNRQLLDLFYYRFPKCFPLLNNLYLNRDEDLTMYSELNWTHPVVQKRNDQYLIFCLLNGRFKLTELRPLNSP